jgi:polyisoprenoid-binding protein YceI
MTYTTTSLRQDGDDLVAEGDLTIKGVTRPVVLNVEFNGIGTDPWGGTRLGLSARGEINRSDFGISFNMPLDGGGVMVGERIQLIIEVEAVLNP